MDFSHHSFEAERVRLDFSAGPISAFLQKKAERVDVVFRLLRCLIVYRNALRLFRISYFDERFTITDKLSIQL